MRNDEGNDDSIMADIDKIDIIKRFHDGLSSYGAASEIKLSYVNKPKIIAKTMA